jgi:hypothetical protein
VTSHPNDIGMHHNIQLTDFTTGHHSKYNSLIQSFRIKNCSTSILVLFLLCPRMRRVIRLRQMLKVQARVHLRGGDVGVAQ